MWAETSARRKLGGASRVDLGELAAAAWPPAWVGCVGDLRRRSRSSRGRPAPSARGRDEQSDAGDHRWPSDEHDTDRRADDKHVGALGRERRGDKTHVRSHQDSARDQRHGANDRTLAAHVDEAGRHKTCSRQAEQADVRPVERDGKARYNPSEDVQPERSRNYPCACSSGDARRVHRELGFRLHSQRLSRVRTGAERDDA